MIVVFHMLYYVANIIWNKVKPKLLSIEEDKHKTKSDESKNKLYALEKPEGDLDNSEDYDDIDPNKDVCVYDQLSGKLTFVPPLYIQRYKTVVNVLTQEAHAGKLHTVVEYGCAEFSMLNYYKKVPGVSNVLFIDIDEDLLVTKSDRVVPLSYDHLVQRDAELSVRLYCGDVSVPDERMIEADVVVAIELIEHLHPPTLEAVPYNLFGFIQPSLVIITTPNGEFNYLFDDYVEGTFRHDDHKFEWSREQFRSWAENIVTRYPMYSVQISGIGPPPNDKSEEQYGHCSQMAVFTRIGPRVYQQSPELNPASSHPYKLIKEVVYPQKPPDTRSSEQILFDEMTYLLFSWQQDLVPLSKLYEHLNPWCSSVEDLREILERNCRRVIFKQDEQEWYLVDDSRSDPLELMDSDTEEEEQLYSQQEGIETGLSYVGDNNWDSWDQPASSTGILEVETQNSEKVEEEKIDSGEELIVMDEAVDSIREPKVSEKTVTVSETKLPEKTINFREDMKLVAEEKVNLIEETFVKKKKVNFLVESNTEEKTIKESTKDVSPTFISPSKSAVSESPRRACNEGLETKEKTNETVILVKSDERAHEDSALFTQDETPSKNASEKASNSEVRELLNYLLASKLSKLKVEEEKTGSTPKTPISGKPDVNSNSQKTELKINGTEGTETDKGKRLSTVLRNEINTPISKHAESNQSNSLNDSAQMLTNRSNNEWHSEDENREDRGKIRSVNLEQYIRDNLQSGLDSKAKEKVVDQHRTIDADTRKYDVTNDADVDTSSDDEEQSARNEKVRHLSREMYKVEAEIEKLKRDESRPMSIDKEVDTNEHGPIINEENINGTKVNVQLTDDLSSPNCKITSQVIDNMTVKVSNMEQILDSEESFVVDSQDKVVLNPSSNCFTADLSHSNFPAHSSTLETTSSSEFDSSLNLSSILVDTTRSSSGTEMIVSYNLKAQVTEFDSSVEYLENHPMENCSAVSEVNSEMFKKEDSQVLNLKYVKGTAKQSEIIKDQKDDTQREVVAVGNTKSYAVMFQDSTDVLESVPTSKLISEQDSSGLSKNTHKTNKLRDITNENSQNVQLQSERKITNTSDALLSRNDETSLDTKPGKEREQNKNRASELNSSQSRDHTEVTFGAQSHLNREINHLQTKLENLSLYSPERAGRISEWVSQVSSSSGQEMTKRRRRSLKLDSTENTGDSQVYQRTTDIIPLQDDLPEIPHREDSGQSHIERFPDLLKKDNFISEKPIQTENRNTTCPPEHTFDVIIRDIPCAKNANVNGTLLRDEFDEPTSETRKERIDVTKQVTDIASGIGSGAHIVDDLRDDDESDVDDYMSCAETTTGSFHTVRSDARSNGSDSVSMYSCGDARSETASDYQSSYYSMSSDSDSDDTLVESEHDETFQFPCSVIHSDDD